MSEGQAKDGLTGTRNGPGSVNSGESAITARIHTADRGPSRSDGARAASQLVRELVDGSWAFNRSAVLIAKHRS